MGRIAKMYHDVEDDADDDLASLDFFAFAFCDFGAIVDIDLNSFRSLRQLNYVTDLAINRFLSI